ncbi:unnamed protein product [Auanema sp. JU1783]|nr:unnamed protein product [Auanema sp. JU1783]
MAYNDIEYWYPAICAITYYVSVFILAEISRKIVDKYCRTNSSAQVFFIELIGTVQACTCVYENGIIAQIYGLSPVFVTVAVILFFTGRVARGACISPLRPMELAFNKVIGYKRLFVLLSAEIIGAAIAARLAMNIWYYSADYASVHADAFISVSNCRLQYKADFAMVIAFELVGTALLRILVTMIPPRYQEVGVPTLISSFIIAAILLVGVPGLNPVVASSRMFGCQGIDQNTFIAVYWICPIMGWFVGAEIQKNLLQQAPLKLKKKTK